MTVTVGTIVAWFGKYGYLEVRGEEFTVDQKDIEPRPVPGEDLTGRKYAVVEMRRDRKGRPTEAVVIDLELKEQRLRAVEDAKPKVARYLEVNGEFCWVIFPFEVEGGIPEDQVPKFGHEILHAGYGETSRTSGSPAGYSRDGMRQEYNLGGSGFESVILRVAYSLIDDKIWKELWHLFDQLEKADRARYSLTFQDHYGSEEMDERKKNVVDAWTALEDASGIRLIKR